MSTILETIAAELGPTTLSQVGASVGASETQTQSMLQTALPMLVSALAKNTQSQDGATNLASALDKNHSPNLLEQLAPLAGTLLGGSQNANQSGLGSLLGAAAGMLASGNGQSLPASVNGAGILGHILGGNQNNVAGEVSKASGVDTATVIKFLIALAPVVMSALGTLKAKQNLDANGVSNLLQNEAGALGAAPQNTGFDANSLLQIGGALAQSGLLGKLFG